MFKQLRTLVPALAFLSGGWAWSQEQPQPEPVLLFEIQASVVEDTQPYAFQVFGDKEAASFTAYGIQVVAPNGDIQMLDEFESILPSNSEADALVVEDVNFDGYADVRIMEYLPGGSAVPFFYWLYQPATGTFLAAEAFQAVLSPEVDQDNRRLVSRQKSARRSTLQSSTIPRERSPYWFARKCATSLPTEARRFMSSRSRLATRRSWWKHARWAPESLERA